MRFGTRIWPASRTCITLAVLMAGLFFHFLRSKIDSGMNALLARVPLAPVILVVVTTLGLVPSLISAIIAFAHPGEVRQRLAPAPAGRGPHFTIIACFAIGLGATLTPLGEPLATIAISKLSGEPYQAGFFYLFSALFTA